MLSTAFMELSMSGSVHQYAMNSFHGTLNGSVSQYSTNSFHGTVSGSVPQYATNSYNGTMCCLLSGSGSWFISLLVFAKNSIIQERQTVELSMFAT